MTKIINRRQFLALGGTSVAVGLAGCTSSGEANENPDSGDGNGSGDGDSTDTPAPKNAAIDSIEIGVEELTIALTENNDVDALRLVAPDGSEHSSASVGAGVSTATLAYFSKERTDDTYNAGDYTLTAVYEESVVQEKTVTLIPELRVTDVTSNADGGPVFTLENAGNATAYVKAGTLTGGNKKSFDHDSLRPARAGDSDVIPAGESQAFMYTREAFVYFEENGEVCTGEGDYAMDLSLTVQDPALGEVSGDMSVALTGERVSPRMSNSDETHTCGTVESDSLPVTLE